MSDAPFGLKLSVDFNNSDVLKMQTLNKEYPFDVTKVSHQQSHEFTASRIPESYMLASPAKMMDKLKSKVDDSSSDVAAIKIVELSRKIRDLNAQLSSERNKSRKLMERIEQMECAAKPREQGSTRNDDNDELAKLSRTLKLTEDRVSKAEQTIGELKAKNHIMKEEVRISRKVLELEIGQQIPNLGIWLKSLQLNNLHESADEALSVKGWRGRQQQIIVLKSRLKVMEQRLNEKYASTTEECLELGYEADDWMPGANSSTNREISGATSLNFSNLDLLDVECPSKFQSSRLMIPPTASSMKSRELSNWTRLEQECESLKAEMLIMKTRSMNAKSRTKSLTEDLKAAKDQMRWLLEKGKNDEELIQSLLQNQKELKSMLESGDEAIHALESHFKSFKDDTYSAEMVHNENIKQLQKVIEEKKETIEELEQLLKDKPDARADGGIEKTVEEEGEEHTRTASNPLLVKQIEMLDIERNGLRELIEKLNERLESQIQRMEELEKENNKLRHQTNQESRSGVVQRRPARGATKRSTTEESKRDAVDDWERQYEKLTSVSFVHETVNSTGLNAAAANKVRQRMETMQSAIGQLKGELFAAKVTSERCSEARREDFQILTQIVTQLRECTDEDN